MNSIRIRIKIRIRIRIRIRIKIMSMKLSVEGPATQRLGLDSLEASYPTLRGTIRDHLNKQRPGSLARSWFEV